MTDHDRALRPKLLDDFVGQDHIRSRLRLAIQAAKERNEPLEHVLFAGPAGLGKTTLAQIIANEMGRQIVTTAAPAVHDNLDALRLLLKLRYGDILFIDEIHRLDIGVEEFMYSAIEDFTITVPLPDGSTNARLAPFTLIGATTRQHELTAPLRSRLSLQVTLDYYDPKSLASIVRTNAAKLGVKIDPEASESIAWRARGTPRIANNLLRRARDYAQVGKYPAITVQCAEHALSIEGIDGAGLNELDRLYLKVLSGTFGGGPAGVTAIGATLDREPGTLSDTVEPFLLRSGLIVRSPRGRKITEAGLEAIGSSAVQKPDAYL